MSRITSLTSALAILLLFVIPLSSAQELEKKATKSQIEIFSARDGTLLKRVYSDIAKFKKCEVKIASFTDLLSGQSHTGLRLTMDVSSTYTTDTKIAFLDPDEVVALIQSISIVTDSILTTQPASYTEIEYSSRGGFSAGCYWSDNQWKGYLKLEKFDSDSYVWFKSSDFVELLSVLRSADDVLKR